MTFHRPTLAADMADQLLRPKGLMKKVRSGLFLGGLRRIGKTTFLRGDLIPTLEAQGAIVVYVDLWSNTAAKPSDLLLGAVRKTLADLQRADSKAVGVLKRLKGLDLGAAGSKFGFSLDELGKTEGNTLAGAFSELVQAARTDVVVIIDEVQHAMGSDDGNDMLLALKAARDEINLSPNTPGYFLFVGTGARAHDQRQAGLQWRHVGRLSGAGDRLCGVAAERGRPGRKIPQCGRCLRVLCAPGAPAGRAHEGARGASARAQFCGGRPGPARHHRRRAAVRSRGGPGAPG